MTVGDHFPSIVFSLINQKVSGEQEQEQVFVEMEFTVQISTFCLTEVAMESVGRKYNSYNPLPRI